MYGWKKLLQTLVYWTKWKKKPNFPPQNMTPRLTLQGNAFDNAPTKIHSYFCHNFHFDRNLVRNYSAWKCCQVVTVWIITYSKKRWKVVSVQPIIHAGGCNKLELLISRLKGLSSVTDYAELMHDWCYTTLCSHYAMLLGGWGVGGKA